MSSDTAAPQGRRWWGIRRVRAAVTDGRHTATVDRPADVAKLPRDSDAIAERRSEVLYGFVSNRYDSCLYCSRDLPWYLE